MAIRMEWIKVSVPLILVVVMFSILMLIVLSIKNNSTVEAATTFTNRAYGSVQILPEPSIEVMTKVLPQGNYEYDVQATLNMMFVSQIAKEYTVVPAALFKGVKTGDAGSSKIVLKSGEPQSARLNFVFKSKEPAMLIHENDREFRCTDAEIGSKKDFDFCNSEPCTCEVQDNQRLLLKNFLFKFSTFQIDPSLLPLVPDFVPKIGPCVLMTGVECPSGTRAVSLKTSDEKKTCDEQDDKNVCAKSVSVCGTQVDVKLEKTITRESLFGRLMPGTPRCSDKFFAVSITVGDTEKNAVEWAVGEEITFLFWENSFKEEEQDCWNKDTAGCKDLFIGSKTVALPVKSYMNP